MQPKNADCYEALLTNQNFYFDIYVKPKYQTLNKYFESINKYNRGLSINNFKVVRNVTLDQYFDKYGNYVRKGYIIPYYKEELCLLDKYKRYWEVTDKDSKYFLEVPIPVKKIAFAAAGAATVLAVMLGLYFGGVFNKPISYINPDDGYIIDGKSYDDIETAIDDMRADGKTDFEIKLNKDVEEVYDDASFLEVYDNETFDFDLNGHKFDVTSNTVGGSSLINNTGHLVISDSSADPVTGIGTGVLTHKATSPDSLKLGVPSYANNVITNKGTLIVNSGEIFLEDVAQGDACFAIDAVPGSNDVSTTINNGWIHRSISSGQAAVRIYATSETYQNKFVMNGGTIEGAAGIWLQMNDGGFQGKADFTINDGKVIGHGLTAINVAVASTGDTNRNTKSMSVRIKGGEISNVKSGFCAIFQYSTSYANTDYLKLSGGLFKYVQGFGVCGQGVTGPSVTPTYPWIATGYKTVWNEASTPKTMQVVKDN